MFKLTKGINTYLSPHFSSKEFDCKCRNATCQDYQLDRKLIDVLEQVREHFNTAVMVTSGYRCPAHNAQIGGAKASFHMLGKAVDFVVKNKTITEVFEYLDQLYPQSLGLIDERSWVHLDTRNGKYREKVNLKFTNTI